MKFFKIFVAAVLLSVCSLAGSDAVGIINLWDGETVNGNNFTVVAKGYDYAEGENLTIQVMIYNNSTGVLVQETLQVVTK